MRRTGGFTLLELMIAVAVLGILAGILVLSFSKPTRKSKTRSEANAMFAEFHRAENQAMTENGAFFSTGTLYPTGGTATSVPVDSPPPEWDDNKVVNYPQNLYCGYVTYAGTKDDDLPAVAAEFDMLEPNRSWYVIYAECNIDDDTSTGPTRYFASSVDATLQVRDEGK